MIIEKHTIDFLSNPFPLIKNDEFDDESDDNFDDDRFVFLFIVLFNPVETRSLQRIFVREI